MKTYRVGVLGCGEVWRWHKLVFAKSPRLVCAAVFDPVAERCAEAAAASGGRQAASADEVLTADDVDIVAILTPVFTHLEMVETATAAGKHLMLEKPMSLNLADGQRIVDAIRAAGVKCFHPTIRALSSDLFSQLQAWTAADGPVGPIRAGFYHLVATPVAPSAWMLDRNLCFPPAEYDPHVLDTFLTLTGDQPKRVWCNKGRHCRPFAQDDVTNMVITFRDNRYLQIDVHWVLDPAWQAPGYVTFDLVGERGYIKHNWFSAEWYATGNKGSYKSERVTTGGQRWDHYEALIEAIENDTELAPNEQHGLAYVRIQDAALRSAQSGQTIEL